jgi:hypothetical protein
VIGHSVEVCIERIEIEQESWGGNLADVEQGLLEPWGGTGVKLRLLSIKRS